MVTGPDGVWRLTPQTMACATLRALGSLTARAPVKVATERIGLLPVQPWQEAQAPAKSAAPRASDSPRPSFADAGAGALLGAGKAGSAIGGMVRRQTTIALMSSGARWLRLLSTCSP